MFTLSTRRPPAPRPPARRPSARRIYRAAACGTLAAVTAIAVGLVGASTAAAAPAGHTPTAGDATAAASWLTGQVRTDHIMSSFDPTQVDYGSTADTVLSLAAAKLGATTSAALTSYLAANVAAYAQPTTDPQPGAYAKLALVAETTGADPTAFGGVDLIDALGRLQCPALNTVAAGTCAAWEDGEFKNAVAPNFAYPAPFTQALGILAAKRAGGAGDPIATAATAFLEAQQCPDGGWAFEFGDAASQCATDGSDGDSTAMAVQALALVDPGAASVSKGVAWLQGQQQPDGSYVAFGAASVNTTAEAAQALALAGADATAPLGWLADQQAICSAPASARGSFAYAGSPNVLATNQAVMALTSANWLTLSASGSAADVPPLTCPAATTTPPAPTTPVSTAVAVAPTTTVASGPDATATLPATGVDGPRDLALAGIGLLALIAGGAMITIGRRSAA